MRFAAFGRVTIDRFDCRQSRYSPIATGLTVNLDVFPKNFFIARFHHSNRRYAKKLRALFSKLICDVPEERSVASRELIDDREVIEFGQRPFAHALP
jgi:hypothetical protein